MKPDLSRIFPFVRPDGSRQFVCTECGWQICMAIDVDRDGVDVCHTCRYIGEHPHLPPEVKALLRGEPS